MHARKKVCRVDPQEDEELRNKIERTATSENEVDVMRKDFHLLDAALATDQSIISRDEIIQGCFTRAAQSVVEIRRIVWVNLVHAEETPLTWLKDGAPPEDHRQLRTWAHTHA